MHPCLICRFYMLHRYPFGPVFPNTYYAYLYVFQPVNNGLSMNNLMITLAIGCSLVCYKPVDFISSIDSVSTSDSEGSESPVDTGSVTDKADLYAWYPTPRVPYCTSPLCAPDTLQLSSGSPSFNPIPIPSSSTQLPPLRPSRPLLVEAYAGTTSVAHGSQGDSSGTGEVLARSSESSCGYEDDNNKTDNNSTINGTINSSNENNESNDTSNISNNNSNNNDVDNQSGSSHRNEVNTAPITNGDPHRHCDNISDSKSGMLGYTLV